MLIQILFHTPLWVFVLLAVLAWVGGKQLLAGRVSLVRVTVLPVAMTALSVAGVLSAFGDAPSALFAWLVAAGASMAAVLQRAPAHGIRYNPATRVFELPGSAVPLALMMGIFFTKYTVGVLLALHPELRHQAGVAPAISALYGMFSGIFAARALRLWRLAIREDRALGAALGKNLVS